MGCGASTSAAGPETSAPVRANSQTNSPPAASARALRRQSEPESKAGEIQLGDCPPWEIDEVVTTFSLAEKRKVKYSCLLLISIKLVSVILVFSSDQCS